MIRITIAIQVSDEIRSKPQLMFPEFRTWFDCFSLRLSPVYWGINVPKGDGSAVIPIPGFLGIDFYLLDMFLWLHRIGYNPYMSYIGHNADCLEVLYERLNKTIERAYQETGGKVRLIGHSLGGILALSAAVDRPNKVAQVITLGTPFQEITVNPWVKMTASLVRLSIFLRHGRKNLKKGCYTPGCECSVVQRLRKKHIPPSVKKVAIAARKDRVVDPSRCVYADGRWSYEINTTHIGLAFNSNAYRIIAQELAPHLVEEGAVA